MTSWVDQLHLGNCIEELNRLDTQEYQADLVFADPPYNIGYSYDVYKDNLSDDAYLRWTNDWMGAASRVLKPTGAFWIAIGDEYAAEVKTIGDKLGLHLRNWVIWYYTFGVHCKQKFTRSHTHLLYFVKQPKDFTFNNHDIRVPSARQLVYNDGRANQSGRVPDNTWLINPGGSDRHDGSGGTFNQWFLRPQDARHGFHAEHDTWYFARVAGTFKERAGFHGCQMPERLIERIIRSCSDPDDVVLDPFAGSASTLIVAKKLGRHWTGYELSPEYVHQANARLETVQVGDPIDGPADPLLSAPPTPRSRRNRNEVSDEKGIIDAFQQTSDGYSVDRLIADPVMNAAFVDGCSRNGIAGRPREWNLKLLGMRKSGKWDELKSEKSFQLSWQSMDAYVFASEIALQKVLDLGYASFDDVLCDPAAVAQFDEFARSFAPGFGSLEYRWAALRLRKDARLWRRSSETITDGSLQRPQRVVLDQLGLSALRSAPGVYVLSPEPEDSFPVYVGATWDLSARAKRTFAARKAFDRCAPGSGEWKVDLYELADMDHTHRCGFQSLLIGRDHPAMNYRDLAASTID